MTCNSIPMTFLKLLDNQRTQMQRDTWITNFWRSWHFCSNLITQGAAEMSTGNFLSWSWEINTSSPRSNLRNVAFQSVWVLCIEKPTLKNALQTWQDMFGNQRAKWTKENTSCYHSASEIHNKFPSPLWHLMIGCPLCKSFKEEQNVTWLKIKNGLNLRTS